MASQFKNPLPTKETITSRNDEQVNGVPQPVVPGEQAQGTLGPVAQRSPRRTTSLLSQNWQSDPAPTLSSPANVAELQTLKQPSVSLAQPPLQVPHALPQTPEVSVQGQHGRYGAGQGGPFPQRMPPGPTVPHMFAPPRRPGGPNGPALPGAPASLPGAGTFNQAHPGPVNVPSAPPVPGTLPPNRPPLGPGHRGPGRPLSPGKSSRSKRHRIPLWGRTAIAALLVMVLLGGGVFVYYQLNFADPVNHIVGQQVQRAKGEEDPNANLSNGILTGPRVNILLLGSDTDQKFQGQYIAQTDIVVTIDPATHSVGMLSIPRDFYIPVPGYGLHKLDEAYGLGGVGLSRQTIEQDFGIPINYYAWVGLDGFIKVINEVGGVDVDVLHPIADDNYPDDVGANANDPYAVKRLYLPPGPQHLDGPTALEYVRSRHADLVGDFGRSARQQQVLGALKTKLANPDIFGHLSAIAHDLQNYLRTDMQLSDVLKLMSFARSLDPNKIDKLILGPPYSTSGVAPQGTPDAGAQVVFPDCTRVVPAISQMLKLGNNAACNVQSSTADPVPTVPATSQPAPPLAVPTVSSGMPDFGNMAGNTTTGLANGPTDLFGVRSLLDLLLVGVFESPDAFQG